MRLSYVPKVSKDQKCLKKGPKRDLFLEKKGQKWDPFDHKKETYRHGWFIFTKINSKHTFIKETRPWEDKGLPRIKINKYFDLVYTTVFYICTIFNICMLRNISKRPFCQNRDILGTSFSLFLQKGTFWKPVPWKGTHFERVHKHSRKQLNEF